MMTETYFSTQPSRMALMRMLFWNSSEENSHVYS